MAIVIATSIALSCILIASRLPTNNKDAKDVWSSIPCTGISEEHFCLLFNIVIKDIELFKNQQWKTTYYVALLNAGIIYISRMEDFSETYFLGLSLSALVVGFSGVYLTWVLEKSIDHRGIRLSNLKNHLSAEAIEAWADEKKEHWPTIWIFYLSQILISITAIAVLWDYSLLTLYRLLNLSG